VKLLLLGPGASWSTADVAAGLRYGLKAHGVEVVDYALDARIARAQGWLHYNWRRAKKRNPAIPKPNVADVFFQAGHEALAMALYHDVDAVLAVSGMFLHPDVVVMMKRAHLQVFVLFTESPYDQAKELEMARLVDGCWTNERTSVAAFQAVNPHSGYLPHAWHPERHRPGPHPGDADVPAHDVVFVGSSFQERTAWLSAIDWTGIDLGLYGSWEGIHKTHRLRPFVKAQQIDNVTTAALYRRAKVGLNLYRTSIGWGKHAQHITQADSLNPRAYELAACGAFHLSHNRGEVREVFGARVPTFTTPAEGEALIRQWLEDGAGRAQIAAELPACVAESSWATRATTVIGDLQTLLQRRAA
jgi:spore maturation protein CgeB